MKSNTQKVVAFVQAVAALVVVGATRFWAPVCQGKLELATGKKVAMKCFYTDRVSMIIAGLIILAAVLIFISKHEVKKLYFITLVLGVLLFLTYTHIIGVCMNPEMPCNITALWGKAAAVAVSVMSLIGIFVNKETQVPNAE